VENEAWDGRITNIVGIIDAIGHDEIEEEVIQTSCRSQCAVPSTTTMQIIVQNTPARSVGVQSTPRAQKTPASSTSSSTCPDPTLASLLLIQMDLSGHSPLRLNHHFEPMVLINRDIHPFDGEWNVMSSSFVNYRHHLMIY
jgi:hypothetical protein